MFGARTKNIMKVEVAIAGGGPFGLMLAIELGRRSVCVALFDAKPSTAFNPQANATQARTMEYFRRLGFAHEIRAKGLPSDYPTDIAYFTRYSSHQLARFRLPASRDAEHMVNNNVGSWSAAEAPHRISQKFVEPVLKRHAEQLPGVTVQFDWALTGFDSSRDRVSCQFQSNDGKDQKDVTAQFLIGADGARSFVRRKLGISYSGEYEKQRHFMGGRMYAVYLRSPRFYEATGQEAAWMNWTFNPDRRAFMAAVDGQGEFAFHTQLRDDETEDTITDEGARRLFQEACGKEVDCEILGHMGWTAGHALVADSFGSGRVLMGGDAAHLFTPAGGLGYNTAVEDAVNLGWKLAAVLKNHAGPALLKSYEAERRRSALRNTNYARELANSIGNYIPKPGIETDSVHGAASRARAGSYLEDHARREFNIPGITFGSRYDGSPVLPNPEGELPEDKANQYTPSGLPGGRPPHWWFPDGTSLFDKFGFNWTLLCFSDADASGASLIEAARSRGLDLKVVHLEESDLRQLYAAPLTLIRPDQSIGWCGTTPTDPDTVWNRLLGFEPADNR